MESKLQKRKNKNPRSLITREFFEGPIPPPSLLRQYEEVFPGAAERIVTMAEKQSAHRQKLESDVISSDISNEKRGMNYSLMITLILMVIGAILIYLNRDTAGYFSL